MPTSRPASQPRLFRQREDASARPLPAGSSDGLVEILQRQQAILQDLLALAEEKRALILNRQASRVAALLGDESAAAQELARLEEARRSWGGRRGLDPDGSLDAWLQHLPEPERHAVIEAARQLRELASRLAAQNAVNQALLQQELAYIEFAVNILRGPDPADMIYGPPAHGTANAAGVDGRSAQGTGSSVPQGPGTGSQAVGRSLFDFQA